MPICIGMTEGRCQRVGFNGRWYNITHWYFTYTPFRAKFYTNKKQVYYRNITILT